MAVIVWELLGVWGCLVVVFAAFLCLCAMKGIPLGPQAQWGKDLTCYLTAFFCLVNWDMYNPGSTCRGTDLPPGRILYIHRTRQHLRSLAPVMDDYDGQMIFGGLVGLKLPDICLAGEKKPRKTSPRKLLPTGDRTRVRCVKVLHSFRFSDFLKKKQIILKLEKCNYLRLWDI